MRFLWISLWSLFFCLLFSLELSREKMQANPNETLDLNELDLDLAEGRADFARFHYFLVNGPSDNQKLVGPPKGYLSLVNQALKPVNEILSEASLGNCLQVVEKNNLPIEESKASKDYVLEFEESTAFLPSHFDRQLGLQYQKQVSVFQEEELFLEVHFQCAPNSNIETQSIRMDLIGTNGVNSYLIDSQYGPGDSLKIDFYLDGATEKIAARFQSDDGDLFRFTSIRVSSLDGPSAFAAAGSSVENLISFRGHHDGNENITNVNSDVATSWLNASCLNLNDNEFAGSCPLIVQNETASEILAGSGAWTIQNVADFSLELLP